MTPSLRVALATLAAALLAVGAVTHATMDAERDGHAAQINAAGQATATDSCSQEKGKCNESEPVSAAPYSSWLVQCMNGGSFSWIDANGDLNTTICSTTRIVSSEPDRLASE